MNWDALLTGAVGAGIVTGLFRLIELYIARGKTQSESMVLRSEASENITEAAQVAVTILEKALTIKATEVISLQTDVRELKVSQEKNDALIKELQNHRDERTKQIEELTENNEALLSQVAALRAQIAKDTAETRELRDEVEKLRQQVAEGEKKYRILKDYTLQLLTDWKAGKPIPEVPPELGDSISGWKYPK